MLKMLNKAICIGNRAFCHYRVFSGCDQNTWLVLECFTGFFNATKTRCKIFANTFCFGIGVKHRSDFPYVARNICDRIEVFEYQ